MERPKGPWPMKPRWNRPCGNTKRNCCAMRAGILGSWADAEDAVQTAFLKVWQRRARLRPDTMLRPLLYRVTCRNALDQLRRARREARREPAPAQAEPAPWLGVEVRAALDALPPADRALVWGQVVEGLSYRELAAIHGKSETICATAAAAPSGGWPHCLAKTARPRKEGTHEREQTASI